MLREAGLGAAVDVFEGLQMVGVGTDRSGPALPERAPGGVVENIARLPVRPAHLADGLLREHGQRVGCFKHAQVSGRRNTEPVSNAKRAPLA